MENIIRNKDLVLSWMEDEKSRFIFEKRCKYSETKDIRYINEMVGKNLLEFDRMKDLCEHLNNKNTYIYGAGLRLNIMRMLADKFSDLKISGIIDSSPEKQGKYDEYFGLKIKSPKEVDFNKIDCLVISVKAEEAIKEIKEKVIRLGMKEENIIVLSEYCIFDQILKEQYFDKVVKFEKEETFIDGGVLDLSATLELFERCKKNSVKKIKSIAFEPDSISYERCEKIKSEYPDYDIELLKYGLYSKNTTLKFMAEGTGASCISDEGTVSIDVVALDKVIDEKVTFIKMDIEGAELEALKGASETIKKYRPKLAICLYHKPEDIIDIPMYIKSLVPEYKLYIRHYSSGECETVLYAIP